MRGARRSGGARCRARHWCLFCKVWWGKIVCPRSYSHSEAFFVGGRGGVKDKEMFYSLPWVRIVDVEAVPVTTPPARRAQA
jgi:hypothetical protein